jgi:hypothetical protein
MDKDKEENGHSLVRNIVPSFSRITEEKNEKSM